MDFPVTDQDITEAQAAAVHDRWRAKILASGHQGPYVYEFKDVPRHNPREWKEDLMVPFDALSAHAKRPLTPGVGRARKSHPEELPDPRGVVADNVVGGDPLAGGPVPSDAQPQDRPTTD